MGGKILETLDKFKYLGFTLTIVKVNPKYLNVFTTDGYFSW